MFLIAAVAVALSCTSCLANDIWPIAASSCAQPSFFCIWDHLNNTFHTFACMWSLMLFALDMTFAKAGCPTFVGAVEWVAGLLICCVQLLWFFTVREFHKFWPTACSTFPKGVFGSNG